METYVLWQLTFAGLVGLSVYQFSSAFSRRRRRQRAGFGRKEYVVRSLAFQTAQNLVEEFFYSRPSRLTLGMHVPFVLRRRWWHVVRQKHEVLQVQLELPEGKLGMLVTCSPLNKFEREAVSVRFVYNVQAGAEQTANLREIAEFTALRLVEHLERKRDLLKPPSPPPPSGKRGLIGKLVEPPPSSISWPAPHEYNEAVQNPASCFDDADLRQATAELTELGMPRVVSGGFANVYRLTTARFEFAVRCFVVPVRDQYERYRAISRFLLQRDLSSTVSFQYLEKGIKIGAGWYPIVKMDWIEGLPLHLYIEQNLNSDALTDIRRKFHIMLAEWNRCGVAHGDLQHGNIIVSNNELYLVDYDGMFVPELDGLCSNELGHPNYQHPGRTTRDFNAALDNFSSWVIDTSLLCLSKDLSLWSKFEGGDECLLFRKNDLARPHLSVVFSALCNHRCDEIRARAKYLRQLLDMSLDEVPPLLDQSVSKRHLSC